MSFRAPMAPAAGAKNLSGEPALILTVSRVTGAGSFERFFARHGAAVAALNDVAGGDLCGALRGSGQVG